MMYSYRRTVIKWILTYAVALLIGAGVGIAVGRYYLPNTAAWDLAIVAGYEREAELRQQAEEEYYRGVYDILGWIGQSTGMAVPKDALVRKAHQSGWYEKPSDGWQWPLSE